jgi:hypothetical protein
MGDRFLGILANLVLCVFITLAAGCATAPGKPAPEVVAQPQPVFPPQGVMKTGDYAGFLSRNEGILKTCKEPEKCTEALFNIAFLYCYPKSPYFNPIRGRKYINDLIKGAPDSPFAYQAQVWDEYLKRLLKNETRKPRKDDVKSKEGAPEELPQTETRSGNTPAANQLQETESAPTTQEPNRSVLEEELKTKDATIKELRRQIERARQIDIEIEKKERGLLY